MPARHAVLLTPSISLRLIQPFSCAQITPVYPEQRTATPRIPFFVFKTLRTLSFSVSRKSCVCRSYENGRVCTNNSHSGTPNRVLTNMASTNSHSGVGCFFRSAHFAFSVISALNPSFPFDFQLSTFNSRPPRSLSPFFSNSCGLFCTQQKLNSFVFMEFQTLCTKHRGVGALLLLRARTSALFRGSRDYGTRFTILFRWKIPPAETASAPPAERPRWHRV